MRLLLLLFPVLALLGCGDKEGAGEATAFAPQSNLDFEVTRVTHFRSLDGEFYFYFSNQSPNVDPVDFSVYIDDAFVLTVELPFGNAHYQEAYELSVQPGDRKIKVVSTSGEAVVEKTITVEGKTFLSASFWQYNKEDRYGPAPPKIILVKGDGPFLML